MNKTECSPIRLVLHTEDTVLALGALSVLSALPQFHVMDARSGVFGLIPFVEQSLPDLILIDLTPRMTFGLITALRKAAPHARVVLWGTVFSEELRHHAREAGVAAFLSRDISTEHFVRTLIGVGGGVITAGDLVPASKPANSRTVLLTNRESQLVALLAQGLKNKEIATCIGIAEGTVRVYLSKLFAKIGARDRFEVAVFGLKNAYCGEAAWDGRNGFVTEPDEERARPVLKSLVLVEPDRKRGYAEQARAVNA